MDDNTTQLSNLLHQAAETHHIVFAIVDGEDPDWATWYSDWLANLSRIADLVGRRPVRSELTYLLVSLDREYTHQARSERWEDFYATRLMQHFATSLS